MYRGRESIMYGGRESIMYRGKDCMCIERRGSVIMFWEGDRK